MPRDSEPVRMPSSTRSHRIAALLQGALWVAIPSSARAAFLHGEALDTMADWLAIIVICVVPIGAIVIFWLVHILPEKVAEKRHHPQQAAINTLCLLSLVFGGLLWPIAWLWAYTRPIGYKMAYGTEKHDDYFIEKTDQARAGKLLDGEIEHLRDELDSMAARGTLPAELRKLRAELDALPARAEDAPPAPERKA
jgi:CBS domain containing-hemolysin-like protein